MATTTSNRPSGTDAPQLFVSSTATRIALMSEAQFNAELRSLIAQQHTIPWAMLLGIKMALPEESRRLVVPHGGYANDILQRIHTAALSRVMERIA